MRGVICDVRWSAYLLVVSISCILPISQCQIVNRLPHFIPGSGDMARFSLSENTTVGSVVYQLRGSDPDGGKLHYSISGPAFSVNRDTGVVRLRQELDRETQDTVEVIISVTDEGVLGTEPNTISIRRVIPIRDYNDNSPTFVGRPYTANVSESTPIGSIINMKSPIIVTDRDEGKNAEMQISCYIGENLESDICETFEVIAEKLAEGNYTVSLKLLRMLDFETRPSYIVTIMAKDGATTNPLTAFATISVNVLDVQDQPPIFLNAPFSATIDENTPEGTSVLTITAIDGDTGNPRPLVLSLENEDMGHFKLQPVGDPTEGKAILLTTDIPIDRESPEILQNGGVYTFKVRATELMNNEIPADFSETQVTIVVTDVDDHFPEFNQHLFDVSIPENLEADTPLPGLSITVVDKDLGANSRYNLSLRNVMNADDVFAVSPTYGEERTPVVIKVLDPTKLDFDVEDESLRILIFDIVASVKGLELALARVTVNLQDVNDNAPVFDQPSYEISVEENTALSNKIADITATDRDSGEYGNVSYILKGFGSDNFYTDRVAGGIYVKKNLDYEKQTSYSLSIVAVDGGGLETNANLQIRVIDLNDNSPEFESPEYTRTVREGASDFEPQFFVRATDRDGPTQGGSNVTYAVDSDNSISGNVFAIDENTGEITFRRIAKSMDTERGEYELIVSAKDHGHPPLSNTTRVLVRVGISGNQRPVFKGHFRNNEKLPVIGPPSYRSSIPENAKAGYNVTTVSASDPDGLDDLLSYRIVGANDNFVIDDRSGLIQVSPQSRLDRDTNPNDFQIIVNAVDAGFPIPETATTTVYVKIEDINDKPPKFSQNNYIAYISERSDIGSEVLQVTATDTDLDAKLEYKIMESIRATSKAGVLASQSSHNIQELFRIDKDTGLITVNGSLSHALAAVVILTVEVRDLNAFLNKESQVATADVTIYVQSFKDTNPVFKNKGWTSANPVINIRIKEELPIDSTVFTLQADDPVLNRPINSFVITQPDPDAYFALNDRTGEIVLQKRLDYETLINNMIQMRVKANSMDGGRSTETRLNITVLNVNDNSPTFDHPEYKATIVENEKYPKKIISVHAKDLDATLNDNDDTIGYNRISYSLQGEYANLFQIHNVTGEITIAPNQTIDRERTPTIRLKVRAVDAPGMPTDSKIGTADLIIEVLDINDNPPKFSQSRFTAVIPENAAIDSLVTKVTASDPDDGPGGEIRYDFLDEGEVNGVLKMNPSTGEIRVLKPLTGKGRSEPYEMVVRAQDNGGQVPKQTSLYSDASLTLFIGDVSANDGIPFFIEPTIGQFANISENATTGSPVFQVIASDPDSPAIPSGMLTYKIQENTLDADAFRIDPDTGLITTMQLLDRETKDRYKIILEVSDNGEPPQSVTSVLNINVLDIDDHAPRFEREVDSEPVDMEITEEEPIGTIVGNISAIDEDIDENGAINYMFVEGNDGGFFEISRTNDNRAVVKTSKKIDRESIDQFLLTIKCFKFGSNVQTIARSDYTKEDLSEIQVRIKVLDIDDHLPMFLQKNPAVGVRITVPVDTAIATINAEDQDPDALPIGYSLENVTFIPQFYKRYNILPMSYKDLFTLNNRTAEIRTNGSMSHFVDGYFELLVKANNSHKAKRFSTNRAKIFVIRDKSLLRFVFARPPADVRTVIPEFTQKVQSKLKPMKLELHVFDTQVLTKADHSLDFSATSSCFQLFRTGSALTLNEMTRIMETEKLRNQLADVYREYDVSQVESCSVKKKYVAANLMSSAGTWLVVLSALIGVAAVVATCTIYCLAKKYKKKSKRPPLARVPPESYGAGPPVFFSEPIYGPL